MPTGKFLTDAEKAVIDQLHKLKLVKSEIAKRTKRSAKVVGNYLRLGADYGKRKKNKGNSKISNRQKNRIIQLASAEGITGNEIIKELDLPIKKRQVGNVLKSTGHFKFTRMMKTPRLEPRHISARMQWAQKHFSWTTEWVNVVFSDEKKFNFDGPDGFSCYWHDLRKEKKFKYSRNFGGGSLMVWAAFSMHGKTPLIKISGRMNSKDYNDMLEDNLIPFVDEFHAEDLIFQQDNAAIHVSRESISWFEGKEIDLLEWPARSPDLNPIENLWGILARDVYRNGKQYTTIQELEVGVRNAWRETRIQVLETLVNSMPKRVYELVKKQGKHLIINFGYLEEQSPNL